HLVNNREIWIYPFVNPDGRQALTRYNNNGVDLNRDWGYMWDGWGGSSAAFSQPETQAAARWIFEHQFVLSQSNHGGTEAISYPWSYRPDLAPDRNPIDFLAAGYASNSGYSNLPYFQGYNGMYSINGSAKDSFYGLKGSVGWTMEVSQDKIPSPSAIAQYYSWNKPAMLYLIDMVGRGVRGVITDANTGLPVPAIIWVNNAATEYWPIYTDPQMGDFHKFLLPGTYDLTVTANGYLPQSVSNISVVDTGASVVNFQLQPNTGTFAYRIISSQIPSNNFSDEGMTPRALGEPDGRNYSIGKNGWIVLDMGNNIQDFPGNDFKVIEDDASPEGFTVEVGSDIFGPWTLVGSGIGTTEFDLSTAGLANFRYIRIEDDGDGQANVPDAGFDLDAVEGRLIPPSGPYVVALDVTIQDTLGNGNGILEAGETTALDILLQNLGVDPAQNSSVVISSIDPNLTVLQDSIFYGDINAGSTVSATGFRVAASPNTPHNTAVELLVTVRADNGYQVSQPIILRVRKGAQIYTVETDVQFDPTFVNTIAVYPLVIYNDGPDSLEVTHFFNQSPFFWVNVPSVSIAPGGNATVEVNFQPSDTVQYLDTLMIYNNDPMNFRYILPLS
ncbi:MAG: M14 family zinc carboxypeptidase, partial [Calditrichia bacterium]